MSSSPVVPSIKLTDLLRIPRDRTRHVALFGHVDHGKQTTYEIFGKHWTEILPPAQKKAERLEGEGALPAQALNSLLVDQWQTFVVPEKSSLTNDRASGETPPGLQLINLLKPLRCGKDFVTPDGAILVVDVVEGMTAYTEKDIRTMVAAGVRPIFFLNKVDRLFNELSQTAEEASLTLRRIAQDIIQLVSKIAPNATDADVSSTSTATPLPDPVDDFFFGSALHGWAVSVHHNAKMTCERNHKAKGESGAVDSSGAKALATKYWTHERHDDAGALKESGFCKFVVGPIAKLYEAAAECLEQFSAAVAKKEGVPPVNPDSKLATILSQLGIPLPELNPAMKKRELYTAIFSSIFPIADALFEGILTRLPSAAVALEHRSSILLGSASPFQAQNAANVMDANNDALVWYALSSSADSRLHLFRTEAATKGCIVVGKQIRGSLKGSTGLGSRTVNVTTDRFEAAKRIGCFTEVPLRQMIARAHLDGPNEPSKWIAVDPEWEGELATGGETRQVETSHLVGLLLDGVSVESRSTITASATFTGQPVEPVVVNSFSKLCPTDEELQVEMVLEPLKATDQGTLAQYMHKMEGRDTYCKFRIDDATGALIFTFHSRQYARVFLPDFQQFCPVPFKVVDEAPKFLEGVGLPEDESVTLTVSSAKSSKVTAEIRVSAVPQQVVDFIEGSAYSFSCLFPAAAGSGNQRTVDSAGPRFPALSPIYSTLWSMGWDRDTTSRLITFGPQTSKGTNALCDFTKKASVDASQEDSSAGSTIQDYPDDVVVEVWQESLLRGGVLTEGEVRGLRMDILSFPVVGTLTNNPLRSFLKNATRAAHLASKPTLLRAIYLIDIVCPEPLIGCCYPILEDFHGIIVDELVQEWDALVGGGALMPGAASTRAATLRVQLPQSSSINGFQDQLWDVTNGQCKITETFSGWQACRGDPFNAFDAVTGEQSGAFNEVTKIRRRKGLPPLSLKLSDLGASLS
jgi:translation elongation factor EF-G